MHHLSAARNYLAWMLGTASIVLGSIALLNLWIDPFDVFDSPKIQGINQIKPHPDNHHELSRHKRALRICADTGIFGNSRAEIGFDPESPVFIRNQLSVFNHAIPGTGTSTPLKQLTWLKEYSQCMPKTVLIGVEFFDFLGSNALPKNQPIEIPPAPEINATFWGESIFSISGFSKSLSTIFIQKSAHPEILTERGFNPLLNYVPEVRKSGHYTLFRQRAEDNIRKWQKKAPRIHPEAGEKSFDQATLEKILKLLSESGAKTYLIIYPYHAEIRMIMEKLGLSPVFAEWKKNLLTISKNTGNKQGNIEVWDFSGISPETLEPIPAKGDLSTHMNYYWEAGHFKKELGNMVLERLLEEKGGFGKKLSEEMIDAWIAEDQKRLQSLLLTDNPLRKEVEALLLATRRQER